MLRGRIKLWVQPLYIVLARKCTSGPPPPPSGNTLINLASADTRAPVSPRRAFCDCWRSHVNKIGAYAKPNGTRHARWQRWSNPIYVLASHAKTKRALLFITARTPALIAANYTCVCFGLIMLRTIKSQIKVDWTQAAVGASVRSALNLKSKFLYRCFVSTRRNTRIQLIR